MIIQSASKAPLMGDSYQTGELLAESEDVDFYIADRRIIESVSAQIHRREILTLIGPNGSGKTTFIRLLLGLIEPSSGTVKRKRGLTIGYVPQKLHIEPSLPLTVGRFLKFGVSRGPNRQIGQRVKVLEEVGAPNLMNSSIHNLSGGELQRVMLARALLRDPDLLVLDEPVQGVDVTGQAEIYDLITRIRDQRGCGIVMVSHDLHLVMASTDTVICLNHHVCCAGQPEAVTRDPAFSDIFGAEVAAKLTVYHHRHDHVHDAEGRPVPVTAPPGQKGEHNAV